LMPGPVMPLRLPSALAAAFGCWSKLLLKPQSLSMTKRMQRIETSFVDF